MEDEYYDALSMMLLLFYFVIWKWKRNQIFSGGGIHSAAECQDTTHVYQE